MITQSQDGKVGNVVNLSECPSSVVWGSLSANQSFCSSDLKNTILNIVLYIWLVYYILCKSKTSIGAKSSFFPAGSIKSC